MTLRQLEEVILHAKAAQVILTHMRTSYFGHTVYIGKASHFVQQKAIAHIDRLSISRVAKTLNSRKKF